jgi:predicted ABC-type ATPase
MNLTSTGSINPKNFIDDELAALLTADLDCDERSAALSRGRQGVLVATEDTMSDQNVVCNPADSKLECRSATHPTARHAPCNCHERASAGRIPPRLWIIAGPNGAGKSTLVGQLIAGRLPVINPDDIAIALPRRRDGKVDEMAAGRQALQERKAMLATGSSFAVETTLTGSNPLRFMQEAAQRGYQLKLVYIGLASAALSLKRVRDRVAAGGHDVPIDAIMRRFPDSMAKLSAAIEMATGAYVIDNSGIRQRLLIKIEDGRTISVAPQLTEWATRTVLAGYLLLP